MHWAERGLLKKAARKGFRGCIHSTCATLALKLVGRVVRCGARRADEGGMKGDGGRASCAWVADM